MDFQIIHQNTELINILLESQVRGLSYSQKTHTKLNVQQIKMILQYYKVAVSIEEKTGDNVSTINITIIHEGARSYLAVILERIS